MSAAEHLARLLCELVRPDAYPHPVGKIAVAQTHASCVFLTGEFAYKIKKPVSLGFLDYSTLERRRELCEREVALNRRLCPEVYLDVVPVAECGGRLRIGGDRAVVEWAVRMRQLPADRMLPALLERGQVSPVDVQRIARALAHFHASAATGAEIRRYGLPEAISRNVEENFAQTAGCPNEILPSAHVEVIRRYARAFFREHEAIFIERAARDRVRDGHGDLRAQNICLAPGIQDGVQIFDCIEFNDRFRYEDVAADLAYLAMDLDFAGRPDLREALVGEYATESGDEELRRVLRFYQCYRAYVRAKIAVLAAAEPEIPAPERERNGATAAAAFDLARSYASDRKRPLLVAMAGVSGSGKSTLARELARRLPAVRLASDEVRREVAGAPAPERLPAEWYAPERVTAVYAELRRRAGALLRNGLNVILDATHLKRSERRAAAALADETRAEFLLVECRAPDVEIRRRLLARWQTGNVSDADLAVYEAQLRKREAVTADEAATVPLIIVESTYPSAMAREVLARLWTGLPCPPIGPSS